MNIESADVLHLISTAVSLKLVLILPVRLWEARSSTIGPKRVVSWRARLELALALWLSAALFLYWFNVPASDGQHETTYSISLLASTLASLALSLLFYHEQKRPFPLRNLVTPYLVVFVLFDTVYLLTPSRNTLSRPILLRLCILLVLLVLDPGPANRDGAVSQERHGLLSRLLFLWINPILLKGYKNVFHQGDMPPLNEQMLPEYTRKAMVESWSGRVKPETWKSLPLALIECLKRPFLAAVLPRLLLIAFRYSQPILINLSIKYVTTDSMVFGSDYGYWLIVSAVMIYVGLAVSTAAYRTRLDRLKLMTRSALVGLIHDQTMKSVGVAYDNGSATTLMSTDADSLDGIGEMVHEIWAQIVEVLIGIVLLAWQVGWIWPLPLFLIYLCSHMSRFVAKNLQPGQKAWNSATQDRLAATSSVLKSMKVIKMLGFQDHLSSRIQSLREFELRTAAKLRWVMVYYNASANALGIFSPAITLIMYATISAVNGRSLDMETAFTTTAILSMITHPANMVMTFVPRLVGALAGFERIQTFLLCELLPVDARTLPESAPSQFLQDPATAIKLSQVQVGQPQTILRDVNIDIPTGSLTIISGPTSSGKTTLLRTILGEVIPAHGSVLVSTPRIAYCAQRPWLPNSTIKGAIYGDTDRIGYSFRNHEEWYDEVVNACCLTHDIESLADGNETQIGSRGLNLSGGQRQRVALARALFAECDMILLDDTFSGLDGETEQKVFDNLFGQSGVLRQMNATVVIVSNSAQYFPSADHIVVLDDGGIVDQGSWQNLKVKAASIAKFTSSHSTEDNRILSANYVKLNAQLRAKAETELDLARQTGDTALYGYYLRFLDLRYLLFLVGDTAVYAFFITFPQYWLQLWTESNGKSTAYYVGGYFLWSFMSWASTSAQMWSVLTRLAPQSGLRAHERLLKIVLSAPLSFFNTTDNGSILNRFSQDIQFIDKQLPTSLQTIVTQVWKLIMQVALLCVAEKWLTVSFPVCVLVVYMVQKVYLRTSRQLRYLELEARASVFSSFLESIEGLETIRAFGWSDAVIQKNVQSVESSQRPEFLLLCLQRWLSIVLDLLAAGVATTAVVLAVLFRERISGAQVGIALNIMLVANTTLLKLVQSWTNLEISLGAVARLKMLEQTTPAERGLDRSIEPPSSWPSRGQIDFKDISAAYNSGSVAIKTLNLSIAPGQKLIVCGRTGSGKSTLLLTLVRLLELQSGTVTLDDIDINQVPLDILRQRCFVAVSQDPLLLSEETLRFNLDPDNAASDEVLISALNKVGLWSHFVESNNPIAGYGSIAILGFDDTHPVLDQKVSAFQQLSVGQCQIFSICRALVKADVLRASGVRPVVLLDEVTSSLDVDTEATIYRIVDEEFTQNGHTVVIVAHRLGNMYMKTGRDVVAYMADGRLVDVRRDVEDN